MSADGGPPSEEVRQLPAHEDDGQQLTILLEVLEQHPVLFTEEELIRAQVIQRRADRDPEPSERAIRELRRYGLLRRNGDVIEPTLAAVLLNELLEMRA